MATLSGPNQQNANDTTQLNAGMAPSTQGQPAQANTMGAGAVTSTGAMGPGAGTTAGAAPIAGGGGGASGAANKQATSGQYTNFNNYTAANQQAGQRLSNLLSGAAQQQGQAVQNTLGGTNQVASGIKSEQDRISNSLNQLSGMVSTLTPGYVPLAPSTPAGTQEAQSAGQPGTATDFSTLLSSGNNTAPTAGTNATSNYSPVYANLNNNMQQLATGATNAAALGQRASDVYGAAQNQINALQGNQTLAQTESGRQQLLRQAIGQSGVYGQGANVLDQSILAGNAGQLTNFLNNINNSVSGAQTAYANTQKDVNQQLANLSSSASSGQQQAKDLSNTGLTNINATLSTKAAADEAARTAAQKQILGQFASETFDPTTAAALGIQGGTALLNLLKTPDQNYGGSVGAGTGAVGRFQTNAGATGIANVIDPSQFKDTGYLGLTRDPSGALATVSNANEINSQQLNAYSALQKILGNTPDTFAYNQVGTVAPAYTLNAQKFDTDLGNLYNQAAAAASKDVLTGTGSDTYKSGAFNTVDNTANASISQAVSNLINPNTLAAAGKSFGALGTVPNQSTLMGSTSNFNNTSNGANMTNTAMAVPGVASAIYAPSPMTIAGAIPAAINGVGGLVNTVADAINGPGNQGQAQSYANTLANQDLQNKWAAYVKSHGFTDTAKVLGSLPAGSNLENTNNFNVS